MSGMENLVQTKTCQIVTENDVVNALCGMKAGKARSPSGVTSNLLKLCGQKSAERLMVCWMKKNAIKLENE